METIKVFIVEDHPIFRKGLVLLLDELIQVQCVGEASNGKEFLEKVNLCDPDVVLMDITMPQINGIEATKEVMKSRPNLKVIALSMHEEEDYLDNMLLAGAKGFLLKNVSLSELEKAIDTVINGHNYYSVELLNILTKKVMLPADQINGEPLHISKREKEVLDFICQGLTNSEIAEKLFISTRTVENHRAHLIDKTESKNTVGLVLYSIKNNLVTV